MVGDWETLPVAEAPLEIIDGDRGVNYPKQEDFGPSGDCLFLNTGNVTTSGFSFAERSFITKQKDAALRKGKLKRHDVVLTTRGTVGNVALFDDSVHFEHVRINSGMVLLRADQSKLLPRFLYQFVRSLIFKEQVAALTTGSAQPQLPIRDIRRVEIPLPPLAEQKAIAAVLGALDDMIELNRRMNATLEAMARALFQSWFVDFDPVRAKLDSRPPATLDPATAALFPASFDETVLGHIPHGWRVSSIYEIATVIYGAPFASSLFNSEKLGRPLIRIRDLPNESPAVFTTEVHPKGYLLQPGDIAVGMDGEFRAYLWAGVESWLNQRVCVFAPKPGYSAAFVRNSIFAPLAQVEATETATTVIHIGKNDIDRFTVIIPDAPVVEAFKRQCQPWYDEIVANKQQSRTLATLRDTLLPKLLSGDLSVASLDAKPEAAR
jgi:type I restriction enzyme S subunit